MPTDQRGVEQDIHDELAGQAKRLNILQKVLVQLGELKDHISATPETRGAAQRVEDMHVQSKQ